MFGIGMPELMLIFVLALLIFGPKELPRIARTLGKAMGELRRASDELRDGIQREIELAERAETSSPPTEAVPSTTPAEGTSAAPETHAGPPSGGTSAESSGTIPGSTAGGEAEGPLSSTQGELFVETIAKEKGEHAGNSSAPSESIEAKDGQQKAVEDQPETKTSPPAPAQSVETRNA